MSFKKIYLIGLLFLSLVANPENLFAGEKIKIVTTTSTFASITREITGDRADIYSIASPKRDIHFINPTPKDVLKLRKADVFIHGGLDLEVWRGPLVDAAGRGDFIPGAGAKAIDVSQGIALVEIPTSLSRAQGDIHAFGNPHYWLDPLNGKIIARNIAEGLSLLYPEDADFFRKNAESFSASLDQKLEEWKHRMVPFQGKPVITYHNSWPYFMNRFGLVAVGYLEPKPGFPPTPKHFQELVRMMKEKNVPIVIKEAFQENKTSQKLAKETQAAVLDLVTSPEANKQATDYFSMFDYNIRQFENISKNSKG